MPKSAPPLTLSVVDSELKEVVRYLGLKTTRRGGERSLTQQVPPTIPFLEVMAMLTEGPPDDGAKTNKTLEKALEKVASFLHYMEATWKSMTDLTQYEPKFEDVVSRDELNAVLEFIDTDRSGTLELEELSHAFRVSRRFNVNKMLAEGSVTALRKILPNMRSKVSSEDSTDTFGVVSNMLHHLSQGHALKDLLHSLHEEESWGFISRDAVRRTFSSYGMYSDDVKTAVICIDAGEVDKVAYKTVRE